MIDDELAKKNKRLALTCVGVVCAMVCLAYASVPLYNIFCRVTGWGGTTQVAAQLPPPEDIVDRIITVRFDANTSVNLPWDFKPEEISTQVKLGERGITNFISENLSDEVVTGTAVFNVTPLKAGKYFNKIQCFCFGEQSLSPNERVNMPVLFYIDPKLNDDPNLDDVKVITLSYSFFRAESNELNEAVENFYETVETP